MNNLSIETPICARCERNMTCARNGVTILLTDDDVVRGDVFRCDGCGAQVVDRKSFGKVANRYNDPKEFAQLTAGLNGERLMCIHTGETAGQFNG